MSLWGWKDEFPLNLVKFSENGHFGSQGASKSSKCDKEFVCFRGRGAESDKITPKPPF